MAPSCRRPAADISSLSRAKVGGGARRSPDRRQLHQLPPMAGTLWHHNADWGALSGACQRQQPKVGTLWHPQCQLMALS
eukprot:5897275-Pyramimonas_sp.AAC.1